MIIASFIEANKKAYYAALKSTQRSNEITAWVNDRDINFTS